MKMEEKYSKVAFFLRGENKENTKMKLPRK